MFGNLSSSYPVQQQQKLEKYPEAKNYTQVEKKLNKCSGWLPREPVLNSTCLDFPL